MLAPNTILQNRYRVVRLLGQGGMGEVYEALDDRLGCLVALKRVTLVSHPDAFEAFQREAKMLARLRHSALPKVTDYFDEADGWFLVMEFIAGYDLAELLELIRAPFPEELIVRWTQELLKLLRHLHTQEPPILHLDIKPSNLKVTKQEEIFLLDFGLAAGARGQASSLSEDSSLRGYTPAYSPLEQVNGHETDPRSDLYALGATMYHLLTGECPAEARERGKAFYTDRPDPLKPILSIKADVSPKIAQAVHSAMALWRHDRPAGAHEMLQAFNEAAAERLQASSAPILLASERPLDSVSSQPVGERFTTTVPVDEQDDEPAKPLYADKNVQFTVYSPVKIKPEAAYTVLAFAHLSKRPDDAPCDELDPVAEVKQQAARILGSRSDEYGNVKAQSLHAIPRGDEVTFVPVIKGITFIPPSRSFTWRKKVHREEFAMVAPGEVEGQTLAGQMTVFLGSIIIAEVALSITVDRRTEAAEARETPHSSWRLRQIFASYSHRDDQIVKEIAHLAPIFGAQYLIDRTHLLPGEDWVKGVRRLISGADVFQLFWSKSSMRSPEVGKEIDYAIGLGRSNFILPTYWEEPMPRSAHEGLPPEELERLHFYRIYPGLLSRLSSSRSGSGSESPLLGSTPREVQTRNFSTLTIGDDAKFTTQAPAFEEESEFSADPPPTACLPYGGKTPTVGAPYVSRGSRRFSPVLLGCSVLILVSVILILYFYFAR